MQLNGLSMRQLSDPKIHSIAALSNQHASIEVMMYDLNLSFNKLQNQQPRKPLPEWQRCYEAHAEEEFINVNGFLVLKLNGNFIIK